MFSYFLDRYFCVVIKQLKTRILLRETKERQRKGNKNIGRFTFCIDIIGLMDQQRYISFNRLAQLAA